jgi:hypothetical protein
MIGQKPFSIQKRAVGGVKIRYLPSAVSMDKARMVTGYGGIIPKELPPCPGTASRFTGTEINLTTIG